MGTSFWVCDGAFRLKITSKSTGGHFSLAALYNFAIECGIVINQFTY